MSWSPRDSFPLIVIHCIWKYLTSSHLDISFFFSEACVTHHSPCVTQVHEPKLHHCSNFVFHVQHLLDIVLSQLLMLRLTASYKLSQHNSTISPLLSEFKDPWEISNSFSLHQAWCSKDQSSSFSPFLFECVNSSSSISNHIAIALPASLHSLPTWMHIHIKQFLWNCSHTEILKL